MNSRLKTLGVALLAAAAFALGGCSASPDVSGPEVAPVPEASTQADCDGVWVVVDFGDLQESSFESCVAADEPIAAYEAFETAEVELVGVSTSDQFFACRIEGLPADGEALEYEGETYTPDCNGFGPAWAWWGLFVDAGNGWEFAQEGAELQQVGPGEAIALAWQFGDTTEARLPQTQG